MNVIQWIVREWFIFLKKVCENNFLFFYLLKLPLGAFFQLSFALQHDS